MTRRDKDASLADLRAERRGALELLLDKQVGKGRARQLKNTPHEDLPRTTTGSPLADWVTGGGIPMGRITEIYGAEGSGKTTLALSTLGRLQQQGHDVAYLDAEHQIDRTWCRTLGLDPDELWLLQPDNGEEGLAAVEAWATSDVVKAIVVDSVSSLVPKAELEGEVADDHVGRQARLMSKACKRLVGPVAKHGVALLFINQLREKIGVMFGSPETTSGGRALRFYASLRLDCRRGEAIKDRDQQIGTHIKLTCRKNRGSEQFRSRQIPLIYGHGLDPAREVLQTATDAGIISKSGAWRYYGEQRLGQGEEAALAALTENRELFETIHAQVVHLLATGELPA